MKDIVLMEDGSARLVEQACGSCVFLHKTPYCYPPPPGDELWCRRYPRGTEVTLDWWCGEYRRKPE